MSKQCIFCHVELTKSNRSKEHIVPLWLQRHLSIESEGIVEQSRIASTNEMSERRFTLNGFLAGNCCKPCNTGWMSQLETDIAPILRSLFSWKKTLNELSDAERKLFGFWAGKTVLALMSAGKFWKEAPKEHVHQLYQMKGIPPNLLVFATHVATNRSYGMMGFWRWELMGKISENENEIITERSYRVLLHFRNLMILVTYFPLDGWFTALNPNRYFLVDGDPKKVKWILPLFEEMSTTTHPAGLEYFGKNLFAICDNVKNMDLITRGDSKWEVISEPKWSFEDIRHMSV
jgi:hypothetical protein